VFSRQTCLAHCPVDLTPLLTSWSCIVCGMLSRQRSGEDWAINSCIPKIENNETENSILNSTLLDQKCQNTSVFSERLFNRLRPKKKCLLRKLHIWQQLLVLALRFAESVIAYFTTPRSRAQIIPRTKRQCLAGTP